MSFIKLRNKRIKKFHKIKTMLAMLTPEQVVEMLLTDTMNHIQSQFPTQFTQFDLEKNTLKILDELECSITNKLKNDICARSGITFFETLTEAGFRIFRRTC